MKHKAKGCDHMTALVDKRDWRVVWKRQALKGKRNPHELFKADQHDPPLTDAGDELEFNPLRQGLERLKQKVVNRFKKKKPKLHLRLKVLDEKLQPLVGCKYKLVIHGDTASKNDEIKTLGRDALIDRPIMAGPAQKGHLTVWLKEDGEQKKESPDKKTTGAEYVFNLLIGKLNPILKDDAPNDKCATGVQARLNNLGFDCGAVDGDVGPATQRAIRGFQTRFKDSLTVNGMAADRKFQVKLHDTHDTKAPVPPPKAEAVKPPPKDATKKPTVAPSSSQGDTDSTNVGLQGEQAPVEQGAAGSVGQGGRNAPADVLKVKQRLRKLGYSWLKEDNVCDDALIETIKLFQAIVRGDCQIAGQAHNNGLIEKDKSIDKWLDNDNAPKWTAIKKKGRGFVKPTKSEPAKRHDHGTHWLGDVIMLAANRYLGDYLASHKGAAPITVDDVSLAKGGPTTAHATHETGLECYLLLPRTDGKAGGIKYTDDTYDRDAMRAMLKAFRAQALVARVELNDLILIGESLCNHAGGCADRAHIVIKPSNMKT